jgi:hypothetical protein
MFQHYLVQTESDRLGILTPLKRKMFIPKKPFDKQTERFWTFVQHDLTSITTLGSRGGQTGACFFSVTVAIMSRNTPTHAATSAGIPVV